MKSQGTKDKELFNLGWKVDELSRLSDCGRHLKVEVTTVLELLKDEASDLVALNMSRRLSLLSESLEGLVKGTLLFEVYCNVIHVH